MDTPAERRKQLNILCVRRLVREGLPMNFYDKKAHKYNYDFERRFLQLHVAEYEPPSRSECFVALLTVRGNLAHLWRFDWASVRVHAYPSAPRHLRLTAPPLSFIWFVVEHSPLG